MALLLFLLNKPFEVSMMYMYPCETFFESDTQEKFYMRQTDDCHFYFCVLSIVIWFCSNRYSMFTGPD